ncbi:hypothetical protein ARMGADRAFT_1089080, partial [Armillaria gallica]
MAEPPVIKDAAALKHDALSAYEAATVLLQHKVDFPPDKDSSSSDVDEWISDVYLQWTVCSNFWQPAGIKKTVWNDTEYALLECLPLVDKALIDDSCERFNTLVHRAHKYSIPNLRPIPLDTPSPSPEPELRVRTPAPPGTMTPPPAPKPTTPPPQKEKTPVLQKPQSTAPITPQRAAPRSTPNLDLSAANPAPNTSSSNVRASGPAPYNIPKPPMRRFTTPSTTQWTGPSSSSQRKVTPSLIASKSAQPSKAASSSQTTLPKPVDALKSRPPPPATRFVSFDKSTVDDNSGPSDSTEAFQKDWSSPLHNKPAQLKIGPPINISRSGASTQASSQVLVVNAADRPNVIQGPDPDL